MTGMARIIVRVGEAVSRRRIIGGIISITIMRYVMFLQKAHSDLEELFHDGGQLFTLRT